MKTIKSSEGNTENTELAESLVAAGQIVEKQVKVRREREVKGSHLLDPMLSLVKSRSFTVVEKSGFHKITGKAKGRAVYLAVKGGRVDLNGFSLAADAVTQISEEDAKAKHLGKVRGTIDFTKDDASVTEAFTAGLDELDKEIAVEAKPAKEPKAPKAPKAAKPASDPVSVGTAAAPGATV